MRSIAVLIPLLMLASLLLIPTNVNAGLPPGYYGEMALDWTTLNQNNGDLTTTPLSNWTLPSLQATYGGGNNIRKPWTATGPDYTMTADFLVTPGTDLGRIWYNIVTQAPKAYVYHVFYRLYDNGIIKWSGDESISTGAKVDLNHHITTADGHYYWLLMRVDSNNNIYQVYETIYSYVNVTCGQSAKTLSMWDSDNYSPAKFVPLANYTGSIGYFEAYAGQRVSKGEFPWQITQLANYYTPEAALYYSDYNTNTHSWTSPTKVSDVYGAQENYSSGIHIVRATWHGNLTLTQHRQYFIQLTVWENDSLGGVVEAHAFCFVIQEVPVVPATLQWVNGLVWIMIMFLPALIINFFFPRYGMVLGLALMAIVLGLAQPTGMFVSFVIFLTCGTMLFTFGGD